MENELHKGAGDRIFENARELRKNTTSAKIIFWEQVRDRRFCKLKFRRQHPIAGFIADFYCWEKKLIIELDGDVHDNAEQKDYDLGRAFELCELGLKALRFRNNEVEQNVAEVLDKIKMYLNTCSSPI